tara:strand:- start:4496 stop:5869 length:1374 start_codon:yes stop_codon:yes gene_type:complete
MDSDSLTARSQVSDTKIPTMHHLNFHEQRDQLFNELHTRPFPVISSPAKISQLTLIHDAVEEGVDYKLEEYRHICALCARYSLSPPTQQASCFYQDFDAFEFRWERHTEFSTYTFIHNLDVPVFEQNGLSLIPSDWLSETPGQVISGVDIDLQQVPEYEQNRDELRACFEGHRLLSSYVNDEQAQIWTAYRIHSDNMGRFLIYNKRLNACQMGRLVRRLLELETYRMMALLSFPIARKIAPTIREMNLKLSDIIQLVSEIKDLDDERDLLGKLTHLSADIEKIISDTNYRFSATKAYYRLAQSRLEELDETEVRGLQTLNEFLKRRLTPAYLTCETIEKDLDGLSRRVDRASELLRTRMNLTIESQNQDVLLSMNRRAKLQLRMQQAVEGLSVAAISYYLVGLVKYVSESAKAMGWISNPYLVTGLTVPFAILFVMFGLKRMKKKIEKENIKLKLKK